MYIHTLTNFTKKTTPLFLQVIVFDFVKKKEMFDIDKVCKCELFEEVYKLGVTLGFLLDKHFCTETKVSSCIIERY